MASADALFQTRPVADVRVLEAKMEADIEKKKRDLRLMVGLVLLAVSLRLLIGMLLINSERYRDLIEAADSVAKMKEASVRLQDIFVRLDHGCNYELWTKRMQEREEAAKGKGNQSYKSATYPAAVQMKLLVDTPEQIWNALESGMYLRAGRLWDAAYAIFENLQNADARSSKIPLNFPLVQRQWESIHHFDSKILQKAKDSVKEVSTRQQNAAESLCTIMILEKISVKKTLDMFLALRKQTITGLFKLPAAQNHIQDLLSRVSAVFQSTLIQLSDIFFPRQPSKQVGLLKRLILEISDKPSESNTLAPNSFFTLYSEKSNMHVIHRHLPTRIQNHVPIFLLDENDELDHDYVKVAVNSWVDDVAIEIKDGVSMLLVAIKDGAMMAAIRENLLRTLDDASLKNDSGEATDASSDWDDICVHLVDRKLPLWESVYRQIFRDMSMILVENSFSALSAQVDTVVAPAVQDFLLDECLDRSVSNYIWSSDINTQTKLAADILCRVQTPSVLQISESFEKELDSIKTNILPLVTQKFESNSFTRRGSKTPSPTSGTFDSAETFSNQRDVDAILACFQDQYFKSIDKYKDGLLILLKSVGSQKVEVRAPQSIFIARIAKAIAIKVKYLGSPSLKTTLNSWSSSIMSRLKQRNLIAKNDDVQAGMDLCQQNLMSIHLAAMKVWIECSCDKFAERLSFHLASEDWATGAGFVGIWEPIAIEGKDESGALQNYEMKLPVHTSSFVIQALFSLVAEINRLNGFILEKPVLKLLLTELAKRIMDTYQNFLNNVLPLANACDKAYLQILFDYEFLIKVVDGCWSYDGEASKDTKVPALAVLALIRSLIDPVDLVNASTHLNTNLERFYYRSSVLLGCLLCLNPKVAEIKKNPSMQEMHNIIAISDQPPRFTLMLTSLPGATVPTMSRPRGGLASAQQDKNSVSRKQRPRIVISANATANAAAGASNTTSAGGMRDATYSLSGSVLSGVVGLVGAAATTAQGVSQKGIFGGAATAMFGALMGSGGSLDGTDQMFAASKRG
ncbi:Golgi transport complex subunit 1 [Entophlyctis luteolus]|nr:Golgi transport complex subunit 1 [Entophlyctis luteolus]